jgi:hypothetical protein
MLRPDGLVNQIQWVYMHLFLVRHLPSDNLRTTRMAPVDCCLCDSDNSTWMSALGSAMRIYDTMNKKKF